MNRFKQAQSFYRAYKDWIGEGRKPVLPVHAQLRADVCLVCPQNQQQGAWETMSQVIAGMTRSQIELKNKMNLRVRGEKSLHICALCGCVLRLKVHAPVETVKEATGQETLASLPEECWIKKELQQ